MESLYDLPQPVGLSFTTSLLFNLIQEAGSQIKKVSYAETGSEKVTKNITSGL